MLAVHHRIGGLLEGIVPVGNYLVKPLLEMPESGLVAEGALRSLVGHRNALRCRSLVLMIHQRVGLETHRMVQNIPVELLGKVAVQAMLPRQLGNAFQQYLLTLVIADSPFPLDLQRGDLLYDLLPLGQRFNNIFVDPVERIANLFQFFVHRAESTANSGLEKGNISIG